MRTLFVQADLDQRVRIILACIRIGDDAVHADKFIHIGLPGLVIGLPENLYLLTLAKHHGASLKKYFKRSAPAGARALRASRLYFHLGGWISAWCVPLLRRAHSRQMR